MSKKFTVRLVATLDGDNEAGIRSRLVTLLQAVPTEATVLDAMVSGERFRYMGDSRDNEAPETVEMNLKKA